MLARALGARDLAPAAGTAAAPKRGERRQASRLWGRFRYLGEELVRAKPLVGQREAVSALIGRAAPCPEPAPADQSLDPPPFAGAGNGNSTETGPAANACQARRRSRWMISDRELQPGSGPETRISFSLESDPEAPGQARQVLGELGPALPAAMLHDLTIVVTELVTNAVRFGGQTPIGVTVDVEPDGRVLGEVTDGGVGGAELVTDRPLGEGGLGLQIVDVLCGRWGAGTDPSRVWFELDADESQPSR